MNENTISIWRLPASCAASVMDALKNEMHDALAENDFYTAGRLLDILIDIKKDLAEVSEK